MSPRKLKKSSAGKAPVLAAEMPSSSTSSLMFWLLIIGLCAGGYFYYQYQQNQQQALLERRVASDKQKAVVVVKQAPKKKRTAKTAQAEPSLAQEDGESDAELAAREAKERELILAAEELQELREQHEKAEFSKVYDDGEVEEEVQERTDNAVISSLASFEVFGAKPNEKAEYYIYYCSADWCGHCRKNLPAVQAEYKEMRRTRKVELILVAHDKTLVEAKAYAKKCKLKCPAVWADELKSKMFQSLPGYDSGCIGCKGIPHMYIVNAKGERLYERHGSFITEWKQYTVNNSDSK